VLFSKLSLIIIFSNSTYWYQCYRSMVLSVCLSCSCIELKRQKLSIWFLLHTTVPCLSQIVLKFGFHWSTLFCPTFCLKVTHPILIWPSETFDGKLQTNG